VVGEGGVVRPPHLVVPVPAEGHQLDAGHRRGLRQPGQRSLHVGVPPLGGEPGAADQRLQGGHPRVHRDGQPGGQLGVVAPVQLRAAVQLPVQQRPPDTSSAPGRVHPPLEQHPVVRPAADRQDHSDRDEGAVGGAHGAAVARQVHHVVGPPLGEVADVQVLAGVVDRLGGGQQPGRGGEVVRSHRAGGEAVRQLGHGSSVGTAAGAVDRVPRGPLRAGAGGRQHRRTPPRGVLPCPASWSSPGTRPRARGR
jgi:hypothetical protein